MSFFVSSYVCKMVLLQYLKSNNKPKFPLTREWPYVNNCGRQSYYKRIGKKQYCQYKYLAKERVDIGKYTTEMLKLPYLLHHLGNMHTLKLTPGCKFKHIQEIILFESPILFHQNVFFCVLPIILSPMLLLVRYYCNVTSVL